MDLLNKSAYFIHKNELFGGEAHKTIASGAIYLTDPKKYSHKKMPDYYQLSKISGISK